MRLEDYLAGNAQTHVFKKGQTVFVKGAQAAAAFYIIEGEIEIFDDPNAVVAKLHNGEIFGEMALLRYDEYTLSSRAAIDTKVYMITPKMLQMEMRNIHPLIKAIIDMLVDRIHETNQVLIDLNNIK